MAAPKEHAHAPFLTQMTVLVGNLSSQSVTNHYERPCSTHFLLQVYGDFLHFCPILLSANFSQADSTKQNEYQICYISPDEWERRSPKEVGQKK